jgi:hypothetical protein
MGLNEGTFTRPEGSLRSSKSAKFPIGPRNLVVSLDQVALRSAFNRRGGLRYARPLDRVWGGILEWRVDLFDGVGWRVVGCLRRIISFSWFNEVEI